MESNKYLFLCLISLLMVACSSKEESIAVDRKKLDYDRVYTVLKDPVDYDSRVKPILEQPGLSGIFDLNRYQNH